ncbi:hypothetical protein E2C01_088405 [Portunus trituberculatus]|uniref:Uncharacterized protein n=1 Tax=Portunus trituberculatus TaxID=210409 RepID=A0A5B7J953_PORTR|nr:hypothetical protein [Portunus trituberculatus]
MSIRNGVTSPAPSLKACKCGGIAPTNDVKHQHHENGIEDIKGQLLQRRERRSSSSAGESFSP